MRSFINMISASAILLAAHKDQGSPAPVDYSELETKIEKEIEAGEIDKAIADTNSVPEGDQDRVADEVIAKGMAEVNASDAAQDGDDSSEDDDLGMDEGGDNAEELDDLNA